MYPEDPGSKKPGTSQEAAEQMKQRATNLRMTAYAFLNEQPRTAEELSDAIGEPRTTIQPRVSELVAMGLVVESGERHQNRSGKSANVWRITTEDEREIHNEKEAARLARYLEAVEAA